MPKVTYIEIDGKTHEVEIVAGLSVMDGAVENSIPGIDADCGGACACGTCHVVVLDDWIERAGHPDENEATMLEFAVGAGQGSRLSCQIKVNDALDGLVVRIPQSQR